MVSRSSRRVVAALVLAAALVGACRSYDNPSAGPSTTTEASTEPSPPSAPSTTAETGPAPAGSIVVAAAGDIACTPGLVNSDRLCKMAGTADLVEAAGAAVVLTLGDNQYEAGALEDFQRSYGLSWGRFKARTRPSPGNHEFSGGKAPGYFAYFGAAAGPPGRGWYSFDAGGWHMVSLNSNCKAIGGCGPGSAQYEWLRADLVASKARCTLAYWHHPRFSSGYHGGDASVGPLWDLLDSADAELVLSGHDHHYERFAPMTPAGVPDPGGIRQFVVGTGGRSLYPTLVPQPGSEVRRSTTYGVLLLSLGPTSYRWRFASASGDDFTDTGQGDCR